MKRTLFVWRYLHRTTEYVDVVACEPDVTPQDRLKERIPIVKPYEIILERELAE